MKATKFLFLVLLLNRICFAGTLVIPDNVDKVVVEPSARMWPHYHILPENDRIKLKLNSEKIKFFVNDINTSELKLNPKEHQEISTMPFCYEIKIYTRNVLIATFRTNGNFLYCIETKLSYYHKGNLLRHWEYHPNLLEENSCM